MTQFVWHPALCCPIDQLPLRFDQNTLTCPHGHVYDVARDGYVNLLRPGDKRSKNPGDSQAMVLARRDFLGLGHYRPIAEVLSNAVIPRLPENGLMIDAGCGEGHYLKYLSECAVQGGVAAHFLGLDISKSAIRLASRQTAATWVVASNRRIPVASGAASIVTDVFGFVHAEEFRRVLKADGALIRVVPQSDHLLEMRSLLYPQIKQRTSESPDLSGFALEDSVSIRFDFTLDSSGIASLLKMTPHFFRAPEAGRQRVLECENLTLTCAVALHRYRRYGGI